MSEVEQEIVAVASSSNEIVEESQKDDVSEPEPKRRKMCKIENAKGSERLECRLGGILCCTVCLGLPKAAVYQCNNGHLMCAGCFTHVLADARLRDESATCPNCRVEISRDSASRNLAVENAISELPSQCKFCSKEFSRNVMERHQDTQCEERLQQICVGIDITHKPSMFGFFYRAATLCLSFVNTYLKSKTSHHSMPKHDSHIKRIVTCEYKCIGCPWRGPFHESGPHQTVCTHPQKSAAEVVTAAQAIEKSRSNTQKALDNIFNLLSYEKITFNDLQFKPYRTEEYVNKLFYETSRFAAFNHAWVVKANINNSQRDPTQSSERDITYQVILKSKTTTPLSVQYVVLRGPFGDMRTSARIYQFDFTERDTESTPSILPLPDTYECNRLLANKTINFRLIMFLANK